MFSRHSEDCFIDIHSIRMRENGSGILIICLNYTEYISCFRRMRYLSHVLRLPPDRIVRRSLIALVKGGPYYPEGSLFSDGEVDFLLELIETATNRSAWRADVITIADDM